MLCLLNINMYDPVCLRGMVLRCFTPITNLHVISHTIASYTCHVAKYATKCHNTPHTCYYSLHISLLYNLKMDEIIYASGESSKVSMYESCPQQA